MQDLQKQKQKTNSQWSFIDDLLLIMFTSLAPSPIAKVIAFLYFFTSSTTMAFCLGVTRQQITALHSHAKSTKFLCCCSLLTSALLLLRLCFSLSSAVLGNFSFRSFFFFFFFFSKRISFWIIKEKVIIVLSSLFKDRVF